MHRRRRKKRIYLARLSFFFTCPLLSLWTVLSVFGPFKCLLTVWIYNSTQELLIHHVYLQLGSKSTLTSNLWFLNPLKVNQNGKLPKYFLLIASSSSERIFTFFQLQLPIKTFFLYCIFYHVSFFLAVTDQSAVREKVWNKVRGNKSGVA